MKILLPDKNLLYKTGSVDYYDWNYKFPVCLFQRYRFRKIVKLLGETKYHSLLEAGTGSGIFLPELAKHCETIYACDIHSNFNPIRNLCEYYGIKDYNLSTQNIERTDFKDNFFDVVVAVSVLEFVQDLQKALNEIRRILKKDGIFITICPMESRLLDLALSVYSTKSPKKEFGDSRRFVTKSLESSFRVIQKGYMIPVLGRFFPIYTFYKLQNDLQL